MLSNTTDRAPPSHIRCLWSHRSPYDRMATRIFTRNETCTFCHLFLVISLSVQHDSRTEHETLIRGRNITPILLEFSNSNSGWDFSIGRSCPTGHSLGRGCDDIEIRARDSGASCYTGMQSVTLQADSIFSTVRPCCSESPVDLAQVPTYISTSM